MTLVSVVINTLNRADALEDTLRALRLQTYRLFEVIVVVGPCSDHTDDVIASFYEDLKVVRLGVPNLSMSRNLGIRAAAGDIIAFIDDDAVPDPNWLETGLLPFADPEVAASGTDVKDFDGRAYQNAPWVVDSFFDPVPWYEPPFLSFEENGERLFPHVVGCSSFFRKSMLLAVDGFDEEIEYFLDETDVLARIHSKRRKIVRISFGGVVLHRWKRSDIRDDHNNTDRGIKNPYPVVKNKVYLTASKGEVGREATEALDSFLSSIRGAGSSVDQSAYSASISKAVVDGLNASKQHRRGIALELAHEVEPFRPYVSGECGLHVCLATKWGQHGGVGVYTYALARELAAKGHAVRIIQQATSTPRVSFEGGLWIHEIEPEGDIPISHLGGIAEANLKYAAAVYRELADIHRRMPISVAYMPLWDVEGIFSLSDERWPTIVALQTTFYHYYKLNEEHISDLEGFWNLSLERLCLKKCVYLHAISRAILSSACEIEPSCADKKASVISIGLPDSPSGSAAEKRNSILYIGRLEARKNICGLIAAFAYVSGLISLDLIIVGKDVGDNAEGSYKAWAKRSFPHLEHRIRFAGEVSDEMKSDYIQKASFLCMPSFYESFGLVAVEAFRAGRTLVASRAGGLSEVVTHDVNGLTVDPTDSLALSDALLKLSRDNTLRERLEIAGRRTFEQCFSSKIMANNLEELFKSVASRNNAPLPDSSDLKLSIQVA